MNISALLHEVRYATSYLTFKSERLTHNFYNENAPAFQLMYTMEPKSFRSFLIRKGKSPVVPFHGITSPYSYFEEILIFAPIQQEAKHDQEKLSAEQK